MPRRLRNTCEAGITIGIAACLSGKPQTIKRTARLPACFLSRMMPDIHHMIVSGQESRMVEDSYRKVPAVSIDTGVMERSDHAVMIPVGFQWSDVGNWSSLEEVAPRDKSGNVVTGRVVDLGSRNSVMYADRRVVATIGLEDMVVVDTPDATLVCPKNKSQDVKKVVEILKQQGAPEHLEHLTVHRPWGSYTVLEEGQGYKVKRVTVSPSGRLYPCKCITSGANTGW